MPIPSSGPIALAATIQTEFGGVAPTSMSEYYAGGGLVPAGTSGTNGAVPSSGAIRFSQFYGTVKDVKGQSQYTTPGSYTFTVPAGVTQISILAIGAGASGSWSSNAFGGKGGGGGGTSWVVMSVSPGDTIGITVGAGGIPPAIGATSTSNSFGQSGGSTVVTYNGSTVIFSSGGFATSAFDNFGGSGGATSVGYAVPAVITRGGGNGGNGGGGGTTYYKTGGGGAGGYILWSDPGGVYPAGDGGGFYNPRSIYQPEGAAGANGGGGGGGMGTSAFSGSGAGGGGTGIFGQGTDGYAGGQAGADQFGVGGGGGSGGGQGSSGYIYSNGVSFVWRGGDGGFPGGGGGGAGYWPSTGNYVEGGNGANGAVRIIWGNNRSYPSTNTGNV